MSEISMFDTFSFGAQLSCSFEGKEGVALNVSQGVNNPPEWLFREELPNGELSSISHAGIGSRDLKNKKLL